MDKFSKWLPSAIIHRGDVKKTLEGSRAWPQILVKKTHTVKVGSRLKIRNNSLLRRTFFRQFSASSPWRRRRRSERLLPLSTRTETDKSVQRLSHRRQNWTFWVAIEVLPYWRCNFPRHPNVRLLVGWLWLLGRYIAIGLCHYFQKKRAGSFTSNTCSTLKLGQRSIMW